MIVAFYTLGCKVNQYDTQTMMELFRQEGYEIGDFQAYADIYVINTCTVTAVSDKKSRQMISRANTRNPNAVIIVAGCYAQRDAEKVLALPGVRLALGNQNRADIVSLAERVLHEHVSIDAVTEIREAAEFEDLPAMCDGRTRAHLKIQEGCNRFCSYCIIPFARGNVRSRSLDSIWTETQRLVKKGFAEFVLTGIHLSSYGTDCDSHLKEAIACVSAVEGVKRIRLSSLEPMILQEDFVQYCSENQKVCPQFHVSMQSGNDGVLRRMNRQYTSEEYAARIACIRKYMPNAAITTDVIAGFPGETEEEHRETLEFIRKIGFARLHVFPYSIREGTAAAKRTDQIDKAVKERRAHELMESGRQMEHAYIDSQLNSLEEILAEEQNGRFTTGYTRHYIHARIEGEYTQGTILSVRLCERENETVICERR